MSRIQQGEVINLAKSIANASLVLTLLKAYPKYQNGEAVDILINS